MTASKTTQLMKPETVAKKLGIFLPAAPEEFQQSSISRDEFDALLTSPPEWLAELKANGPHPRTVVAGKLGVSVSGLARAEMTEPLTTAQIQELLQAPPQWLVVERATQAEVRAEKIRDAERKAEKKSRLGL